MKKPCYLFLLPSLVLTPLCFSTISKADEFSYPTLKHSQSDFGGIGLLQMPSARMAQEGEFRFGFGYNDDYTHYNASLQLFPWLQTNIRYTQVNALLYSSDESFSGDTKYTDKSIDAKLRLLQESYWLPEVSVGFQDFGGTGLFDSEYLVASKSVSSFDFTLGLAWGYLGNSANLSGDKSASNDCNRNTGYKGNGGSFDVSRMFTGCVSLFGGVEYQTPYKPLRLKLEYDGNDYRSDFPVTRGGESMPVSTPWNIGAVYALTDWADIRISYERGNTLYAGLTMGTNLSNLRPIWIDTPAPTYQQTNNKDDLSDKEWHQLTKDLSEVAGYSDITVYQNNQVITVVGEQTKYRERNEGNLRAATLIANTGLQSQEYRFIEAKKYQPLTETLINAEDFQKVANHEYPNASIKDVVSVGNPRPLVGKQRVDARSRLKYGIAPSLQQSIGGSEDFYLYAIGISGNISYQAGDNWILSSSLYLNLDDNYDKFKYTVPPDGTDLKRVRTLSRQYYDQVARISNLQLTYFDKFSSNLYTQFYGGYLETMFAGAGSELLYRPLNSRWAIGIDANYVKQRDPDTVLGLYKDERHYDSETDRYYSIQDGTVTGHATLYWQPQLWDKFDNTLLKLSAGRYLTDDIGMTIDVSKQFSSGVIAGAFATKTNLSAEEYGEGSFTKGFYVSIPLDLMTIRPSQERATISWLPIQRDGGQMLSRKYSLYDMTDARSPWFTREIAH
ncbi:YjbH domain-containing protein [Vibrio ziniensis]|uniref:YjbH domain-containing protein n=1 Tax=Vibrio ziniensis TaxID=2711221 RepID=A0A6G7CGP0_9VIBR|nr:YjbH domain-containing protein [Vibrio ziniensis]QIH41272.1 YjbH domain-containing protein [Vibrio ziniensis]